MKRPAPLLVFALLSLMTIGNIGNCSGEGTVLSRDDVLKCIAKGHPRLVITRDSVSRIKARIQQSDLAAKWYDHLKSSAAKSLSAAPAKYEIPDGKRLLAVSRRVLDRTATLALIHLLEGDKRLVDRVWRELDAAAAFPDWNPSHFLDTAEMTHAFAIGYDWLYDHWTDDQRARLRTAMMEKGIMPAMDGYRARTHRGWWIMAHHNWNQVCNGGISMGALAIADELPDVAAEVLTNALQSIKLPMAQFAPDGGWGEGPGYWGYATSYNVVFLAALESALGTDFGLAQTPGFADTGLFPIYMSGPTGLSFAFADAHEGVIHAPQMFWLAQKFSRPEYAGFEREHASPAPLDLVWLTEKSATPQEAGLPLDKHFRHVEAAGLRSAWNDKNALYFAFKAGDNKFNHSHLDIGTFVLDALGQRWACALSGDNYNLPGYFGRNRWTYYRLRAEGHNTLVIAPGREADQDPRAAARIIRFESPPAGPIAIAELTPAYQKHARSVLRGVKMPDRKYVLMQDDLDLPKPSDVWWFMHTRAHAEIQGEGKEALLTQKDARLLLKILSPADAKFTVMDAAPLPSSPNPDGQGTNKDVRKLAIHLSSVTTARISVVMAPTKLPAPLPDVRPVQEW